MTDSQLLVALLVGRHAGNVAALNWLDAEMPLGDDPGGPFWCTACPLRGQCESCAEDEAGSSR